MTSLFGGGSQISVNATGTLVPQQFTPTDGQTVFTLTLFQYTPNTNSLLVFINGNLQAPSRDYTETSPTTFTLTSPVSSLDTVRVIGFPLANFFQAGVGNLLTDIPTVAVVQNNLYSWCGTVTGSANVLVGTPTPAPAAVTAGMVFRFIAASTNTGAATFNGVSIKKVANGALNTLDAGDIVAGAAYQVVFDGTFYQLGGGTGGTSSGSVNLLTQVNGVTVPAASGMSLVGPITVPSGKAITVPTGSRLVIL